MKVLSILILLLSVFRYGICQQEKEILEKYRKAIASVESVSYDVARLDEVQYVDSARVNKNAYKGKVWLQRDLQDSLFGFRFMVTLTDQNKKFVYDKDCELQLNLLKRTYKQNRKPTFYILKSAGGLLVTREFLMVEPDFDSLKFSEVDKNYILTIHYPYDSLQQLTSVYKVVYLNKQTFLPEGVVKISYSKSRNNTVVRARYTKMFTNIKVNSSSIDKIFSGDPLKGYEKYDPNFSSDLKPLMNKPAPQFTLRDFTGKMVSSNELQGKIVLLDFWATWCGPCISAMPKVQALYEKYKDEGVVVLGVLTDDENFYNGKKIIKDKGYTYPNLISEESVKYDYCIRAVPEYVIINKKGDVIYARSGYSNEIENVIKKNLK